MLERVEELVAAGRRERDRAQAKLEAATRVLLADEGEIDTAEYGRVLNECAPWIGPESSGSIGVGDAGRQVRMRATMIVFGMADGIYRKLRDHCADVVAVIGGVDDPPAEVWQASSFAEASTVMIRAGREADWVFAVFELAGRGRSGADEADSRTAEGQAGRRFGLGAGLLVEIGSRRVRG